MRIYDGREHFYQWDLNQKIASDGLLAGEEVHFYNIKQQTALVTIAYELGGQIVADVPNILLQCAYPIIIYRYKKVDGLSYTAEHCVFEVEQRVKPSDYVYTETEIYTIKEFVDKALEEAKESGEFKGEKGEKGERGEKGDKGDLAELGVGCTVGLKGYWITAVSTSYNMLRLSTNSDRASVGKPSVFSSSIGANVVFDTGYAVGDEFSIITPKNHYILCGKITAIENNRITCEFYTTIDWDAGDPIDNNDYSFVVPAKPDVGVATISDGGVSEGYYTRAGGDYSHSEGGYSQAVGSYSHAEGLNTFSGYSAHSEGEETKAIGKYAHAEGFKTVANNNSAHAEGEETVALGKGSHTEGYKTNTTKAYSHAEGYETSANHNGAHSEGYETEASGQGSHSEGKCTKASAIAAHAEGYLTEASGDYSHSGGWGSKAKGEAASAEGRETEASGLNSHAEGHKTVASGSYSHAGGYKTRATAASQTVIGRFNNENPNAYFIVGNGKTEEKRSNAFEVISKDGVTSIKVGNTEITEAQLVKLLALI